jgi:putative spermidine/putrescine transport system substrate-binding protein
MQIKWLQSNGAHTTVPPVNRSRALAAAAGAAVLALGVTACSSATSSSTAKTTQTVTVFTTLSGVIPGTNQLPWQQWSAAFEKANPSIKVNVITAASSSAAQAMYARVVAAEKAGQTPPIDILDDSSYIPQLESAGALQTLTTAEVPDMAEISPAELATYHDDAVPYRGSSVVLAYNSDDVKNPPTTLAGLLGWIKANPGKFAYNLPSGGGSGQAFAEAVVESDIPAAVQPQFVKGYDESLEKYWTPGLAELKSLTPDLYGGSSYPSSNNATLTDLGNGSIEMGPVWSDGANAAIANGELPSSIKFTQISPAFYGGPSYLTLMKGSPNSAAAEKLINYMLTTSAQQLVVSGLNGYPGVELKYEPASVQQKFAGIDTVWTQGWYSSFSQDLNSEWQQSVG